MGVGEVPQPFEGIDNAGESNVAVLKSGEYGLPSAWRRQTSHESNAPWRDQEAPFVLVGCCDGLAGSDQVVPGPVVSGIVDAGFIEHVLL